MTDEKIGVREFKVNSFSIGGRCIVGVGDTGQVVLKTTPEAIYDLYRLLDAMKATVTEGGVKP